MFYALNSLKHWVKVIWSFLFLSGCSTNCKLPSLVDLPHKSQREERGHEGISTTTIATSRFATAKRAVRDVDVAVGKASARRDASLGRVRSTYRDVNIYVPDGGTFWYSLLLSRGNARVSALRRRLEWENERWRERNSEAWELARWGRGRGKTPRKKGDCNGRGCPIYAVKRFSLVPLLEELCPSRSRLQNHRNV